MRLIAAESGPQMTAYACPTDLSGKGRCSILTAPIPAMPLYSFFGQAPYHRKQLFSNGWTDFVCFFLFCGNYYEFAI